MPKSVVCKFNVEDQEIPENFRGNTYSDRIVQSRSIADIDLSAAAVRGYFEVMGRVDFHAGLSGDGVEVAVSKDSAPHDKITPYKEQVKIALEGIAALENHGAYGLFAEMGLGKTLILGMMASHFIKTTKSQKVLYVGVGNWFTGRKFVEKNGKAVSREVMGDGHKLIAAGGIAAADIVEFKGKPLGIDSGVIFTTYGKLKSSPKGHKKNQGVVDFMQCGNFKMLVDSLGGEDFDGLVVFDEIDEAANTGNLTSSNIGVDGVSVKNSSASKAYLACQQLQAYFKHAKFVYSSGTPTTSKYNSILAMSKLPLWGEGQHVKTLEVFKKYLEEYKLLFLEENSRDLRYRGMINYLAHDRSEVRSLIKEVPMSEKNIMIRDGVALLWNKLFDYVDAKAVELSAINPRFGRTYRGELRKDLSLRMQSFGMLLNNSFRAPVIAENIVRIIKGTDNDWDLKSVDDYGLSPVLFMDKTYDAGIKREIVRAKIEQGVADVAALDVAQMDFSVKSDFLALIENGRWRYEMDYEGDDEKTKVIYKTVSYKETGKPLNLVWDNTTGDYRVVPHDYKGALARDHYSAWEIYDFGINANHVPHLTNENLEDFDEEGVDEEPVFNIRIKDKGADKLAADLRALVGGIDFPLNAMDYIQNYVADNGGKIYELSGRGGSWRSNGRAMVMIPKLTNSMDDYLSQLGAVAIVTRAGARAISLHDREAIGNKSQRVGIFADFGWNANKTIQASGRILRLGQIHYPIYVLPRLEDFYEYRVTSGLIKAIAAQGAITAADSRGKDIELLSENNDFLDHYGQRALNQYLVGMDEHQSHKINLNDCPALRGFIESIKAESFGVDNLMDMKDSMARFISTRDNKGIITFFNRTMLLPYEQSQAHCRAIMAIRAQLIDDDENNDIMNSDRVDLKANHKIREINLAERREHVINDMLDSPALYKFMVDRLVYTLSYARVSQRKIIKYGFWGQSNQPAVMVPAINNKNEKVFDVYTPQGKVYSLPGYLSTNHRFIEKAEASVRGAWETAEVERKSKYENVVEYVLVNGIRVFGEFLKNNAIKGLPRDVYYNLNGKVQKISGLLLTECRKAELERWIENEFTRVVSFDSDSAKAQSSTINDGVIEPSAHKSLGDNSGAGENRQFYFN